MAPSKQRERELERQRRLRQEQRRQAARRRARRRNQVIASVLAVGLVLSGIVLLAQSIGGDPSPAASPSAAAAPFPPLPAGADARLKTKPTATLPKSAPAKLAVLDVIPGKGAAVKAGQQIAVNYVGVGFPDGKEFDSSWNRREPFTVTLGGGDVIKGWDQGIVGMKVGGRRQLTIPAALAYGAQGRPPDIKANQSLVFVVDLLSAQ